MAFSFGAPPQPQQSSLFGQPAAQQPATGGFSFGQSAQTATSSAPTFSFGASAPAASSGGFSFGAPAAATTSQPFSFGTTAPAPNKPFSFGAPAAQPAFGAPTAQPSFGATAPASTGFSFGASQQQPQQPAQQPQQPASDTIEGKIQTIRAAWHPESPTCRFQTFFYNVVDPSQVKAYARPPLAQSDAAWFKAVRENPDADRCVYSCGSSDARRMVPVLAAGFDDLKKRADAQDRQAAMHYAKLQEMAQQLQTVRSTLQQLSSSRLSKAETTHTALTARITRLVSRLHPLTSMRGTPLRAEEDDLHAKIERLSLALAGRGTDSQRLAATLNELWVLAARRKAGKSGEDSSKPATEWAIASEEHLSEMMGVLSQQQQALTHLGAVLEDDLIGAGVIREGFGLPSL